MLILVIRGGRRQQGGRGRGVTLLFTAITIPRTRVMDPLSMLKRIHFVLDYQGVKTSISIWRVVIKINIWIQRYDRPRITSLDEYREFWKQIN